jgi:hypothetical protein
LPRGSDTYSWAAPDNSEDAGSFLHLIVIPKKSDIRKELHKLDQVGAQTAFPARIVSKSSYRRIGDNNLVGVRGLLEGIRDGRPGVVYFIADRGKTLIIMGAGDGKNRKNVQYLLDHAVRTIRRSS